MNNTDKPLDPLSERTRANLAYILVLTAIIFLGYILYRWGDKTEILTLIIGLIGGTMFGAPIGVYFAGILTKKPDNTPTLNITGDQPIVPINTPPPTEES